MHIIFGQVPQKVSHFSNGAHVYQLSPPHTAHIVQPLYPPPAEYHSQGQFQKAKPAKRDMVFAPFPEPLRELVILLNANLVTWMHPRSIPDPAPQSHNPNVQCLYHMGSPRHHTNECWPLKHKVQDLSDLGTIIISFSIAQNVSHNPLPLHNSVGPSMYPLSMLNLLAIFILSFSNFTFLKLVFAFRFFQFIYSVSLSESPQLVI